ncbi:MAG: CHAT domain-containing protein, partial [Flavobacteriales bacterium]|nr:CHAT domain-containing protein [Flavobacteriales bacterium]
LKPEEGILICAQNNVAGLRESVFLLAVTSSGVAFESQIPNYSIRNTADLDHKTAAEFRSGYHALRNLVYKPVAHILRNTQRIRVFPSGDASFISFDALLNDTSSLDIRACGPLVKNHAFSYPLLLMQPEREEHVRADHNALYIAPIPGTGQFTDLKRMRSALLRWGSNGSVDSAFTFADLQEDLAKADAIYLAGHCAGAHSREHQPRHYFSTDTSSFSIQPSDLLSLELNADLVVHLACRSGLFEVDRSGGGISFARAFLFAGASNVISSQYLADEGSSIKLISLFRNELAKGLPKDVAMQRAKLAYLEQSASAEEHMPLHWAGWQVLGEAEHMVQTTESPRWWLLVGGAIALLGLALYLKRR